MPDGRGHLDMAAAGGACTSAPSIIREEIDAMRQEMLMPCCSPPSRGARAGATTSRRCSSSPTARLGAGPRHDHEEPSHPRAQVVRSYRDLRSRSTTSRSRSATSAPARRRAAHARVHHEGLLHLRPRPGGLDRSYEATPGLRAHHGRAGCAGSVEADVGMMGGFGHTSTWHPARRRERGRPAGGYAQHRGRKRPGPGVQLPPRPRRQRRGTPGLAPSRRSLGARAGEAPC